MSKVGICRISAVLIIMLFTLVVVGYSQYVFLDYEYKSDTLKYIMLYIMPGLMILLYLLLLSTYILCILLKPENIPDQYNLTTAEIARFMIQPGTQGGYQALSTLTRDYVRLRPNIQVRERDYRHGGLRICEVCSIIKPDRSHHCAICKRCVLRMDHHCHWVNNCIHGGNHKYFIQAITLGLIIGLVTLVHYGINISCKCTVYPSSTEEKYVICLLLYVGTGLSAMISLMLGFLSLDHCSNMFRGQTSYERVYDQEHYNRGWQKNFCEIMGSTVCEWVLPITALGFTSSEYEPLIVTVEETSSAGWLETTYKATEDRTEEEEEKGRSYLFEETISMQQGEESGLTPTMTPQSPRIRIPSVLPEEDNRSTF